MVVSRHFLRHFPLEEGRDRLQLFWAPFRLFVPSYCARVVYGRGFFVFFVLLDDWSAEYGLGREPSATGAAEVLGELPARGGGKDHEWVRHVDGVFGPDGIERIEAVEISEKEMVHWRKTSVRNFVEQMVCFQKCLFNMVRRIRQFVPNRSGPIRCVGMESW